MAADQDKTCKNPPCSCAAPSDNDYCSVSCEGKGDVIELDCECGHPECSGDF